MFAQHDDSLLFKNDSETVRIEPWGPNAFRVRATYEPELPCNDWALLEKPNGQRSQISTANETGTLQHGSIKATMSKRGKITIFSKDEVILEEYARHRLDVTDPNTSSLNIHQREFKPHLGGDYHLTARFESLDPEERIYGMGMYQQPYLNIKGCDLELAQRNSQATVPFAVSSIGYGLLWNNPAIGRAAFGKNLTTFEAYSTKVLDYWIVAGDTPQDIVRAYTNATGRVPMMPEYGLGFWQCKLRYQTQDELLSVAREYRRRTLPIDLIVIDFFHWPKQGEWKFDPDYWPDPGKCNTNARVKLTYSRRHDVGAQVIKHRTNGLNLADRRLQILELRRDATERTPHTTRPRNPNVNDLPRQHRALRRHQPSRTTIHLGQGKEELLLQGHPSLLARRSRARIRRLLLRHLPLPPRHQPLHRQHLPARVHPRIPRRHVLLRPNTDRQPRTLRLGR